MVIEAVTGEGETETTEVLFEKAPVPGEPLELTLDPALQTLAEGVLADEPSASSIVAIRPSSGEILTVANGPGSEGLQTALLGQYPPGSTFKVATSLALNWGIYPVVLPFVERESEPLIGEAFRKLVGARRLKVGDSVVIVSSIAAGGGHADAIQMRTVGRS